MLGEIGADRGDVSVGGAHQSAISAVSNERPGSPQPRQGPSEGRSLAPSRDRAPGSSRASFMTPAERAHTYACAHCIRDSDPRRQIHVGPRGGGRRRHTFTRERRHSPAPQRGGHPRRLLLIRRLLVSGGQELLCTRGGATGAAGIGYHLLAIETCTSLPVVQAPR